MSTWREPFPQWALSEVEDRVTAQAELPPVPPYAPPRTPTHPSPHTTHHIGTGDGRVMNQHRNPTQNMPC